MGSASTVESLISMTMPAADVPSFLSPQEVGDMLHIGKSTIHRWILSGALPAKRIGKQWRVAMNDIEAIFLSDERPGEPDRLLCPRCAHHDISPFSDLGWCEQCSTEQQIAEDEKRAHERWQAEREKKRKLDWWHEHGQQQRIDKRKAERDEAMPKPDDDAEETLHA